MGSISNLKIYGGSLTASVISGAASCDQHHRLERGEIKTFDTHIGANHSLTSVRNRLSRQFHVSNWPA